MENAKLLPPASRPKIDGVVSALPRRIKPPAPSLSTIQYSVLNARSPTTLISSSVAIGSFPNPPSAAPNGPDPMRHSAGRPVAIGPAIVIINYSLKEICIELFRFLSAAG
jgi:hypothetical protein